MKPTGPKGPTTIEFYLREIIPPTPYTPWQQLKDTVAGWWDGGRLSQSQRRMDDERSHPLLLTPWARARQLEFLESARAECILHNGIVDPYRIEMAALKASKGRLNEAADKADEHHRTTVAQPAAKAVPAGPGEYALTASGLAAHREREKRSRDADAGARQRAAQQAVAAAEERIAVVEEKIAMAADVLADRIAGCRRHTSRRIAVYARGITRRHPDAPIIRALTQDLALDEEHTGQRMPDAGTTEG